MGEYIERAAHVGMPVTHGSRIATRTLTVLGGVAGFFLGGGGGFFAGAGVGAIPGAALGTATGVDLGNTAGKAIDTFLVGDRVRGQIIDGTPSILVGDKRERAANADPAKKEAGCDNSPISEGSITVYAEKWNFSRKADRTDCGGKIADGNPTVHIGGERTRKGLYIKDQGTWLDWGLDVTASTLSLVTARGRVMKALGWLGLAASVTGDENLEAAVSTTKSVKGLASGGNTLETIGNLGSLGNTGQSTGSRFLGDN